MGTILVIAGFGIVMLIVWPELIWTIAMAFAPRMPEKRNPAETKPDR